MPVDLSTYVTRLPKHTISSTGVPSVEACELWISKVDGAYPEDLLDPTERQRSKSYRLDIDRRRFVTGCAMARLFIGGADGVEPGAVRIDRTCKRCGEPHGKPAALASEWQYSVSHAGEFVAVAFCRATPVGLDIESEATPRSAGVREAVLTPGEMASLLALPKAAQGAAFLTYWTRKEAVLKCLGVGLTIDPALLDVSDAEVPQPVAGWPPDLGDLFGVRLLNLGFLPGYTGALAFHGLSRPVHVYEVAARQ